MHIRFCECVTEIFVKFAQEIRFYLYLTALVRKRNLQKRFLAVYSFLRTHNQFVHYLLYLIHTFWTVYLICIQKQYVINKKYIYITVKQTSYSYTNTFIFIIANITFPNDLFFQHIVAYY